MDLPNIIKESYVTRRASGNKIIAEFKVSTAERQEFNKAMASLHLAQYGDKKVIGFVFLELSSKDYDSHRNFISALDVVLAERKNQQSNTPA